MYIAILILIIGMIPIMLSVGLYKLYGKSKLMFAILLYFGFMSLWQLDIAVLYMGQILPESVILFLFKLFRLGQIMIVPAVLFIAYTCSTKKIKERKGFWGKLYSVIISKPTLIFVFGWGVFLYVLNWTTYGVPGLDSHTYSFGSYSFYYPTQGDFSFLFYLHFISYVLFFAISFINSTHIENPYLKGFMRTFSLNSIVLFFIAILNVFPQPAIITSSVAVVLNAMFIFIAFVKMYNGLNQNYNNVVERQNKLDYVGGITSSLIHEVKNSLAVIQGYSEIIPNITPLNDKGKDLLGEVTKSSHHLSKLVQSYHEFIKHEDMEFSNSSIYKVVNDAKTFTKKYWELTGINIKVNIPKKLYGYINEIYLTQTFVNLIKNAIEAIPKEKQGKQISIEGHSKDDIIYIDIKDNGVGIPKARWDKIFYPFQSEKSAGMGLGLPFCKKIIFSHRGIIKIVHSDENGTHMQIQLPEFKLSKSLMEESS